ncbi:unnamed protein product [Periconia digitata]|uniref:Aminoglycoside phosphotransferase domain-containing protein n=1 Tax=Periconia digitata TaxID=1303443 RepID=A0A9W4UX62_9PLEO|nr:unnamed protein product [Periconia digitata]
MPGCTVTRYPDSTVIKKGRRVTPHERPALELAAQLNLPVPRVHETQVEASPGEHLIRMDFIPGSPLDEIWPTVTTEEKDSICVQLRNMLTAMRAAPWETGVIGSCSGGAARDLRTYTDYTDGPYNDEAAFNESFYLDLLKGTPRLVRSALLQQLRDDHRIVFSHGDIVQHNILVENGKVTGLIDWEYAGWYPEHWDYIKFFDRPCKHRDWRDRADMIFPETYGRELAWHQGILRWQRP